MMRFPLRVLLFAFAMNVAAQGEVALVAVDPVADIAAERAAERRCDRHQAPRRCVTAAGEAAYECRVTSPLAGLLHWFERDNDDAVVVVVAPVDGAEAPANEVERTVTEVPAERRVERRVVRHQEPLPQCAGGGAG